jgi:peptidoglycan L-alanyl-D-glutamate endopeptidase CwlK
MTTTPSYVVDPHDLLNDVHPDLGLVIRHASQKPQPFRVTYGVRTLAAEEIAVANHHSETLHSRHLPQIGEHKLSCAVDITCFDEDGNAIEFGPKVEPMYTAASVQILEAAKQLNIPIQWGGAVIGAWIPGVKSTFRDWGHYQLPWKEYP